MFKGSRDEGPALIVDVGNGSVGAAITLLSSDRPTLLYSTRSMIGFHRDAKPDRLSSAILGALSNALETVLKVGFKNSGLTYKRSVFGECFVILSSPWVYSKTNVISKTSEVDFDISEDLLISLLAEAREEQIGKDVTQIERKLMRAEINGYPCGTPFGKKGRNAEFSVYSSFAQDKFIKGIESHIDKHFYVRRSSFHSFAFSLFSATQYFFPNATKYFIMDVSDEQTEISIVIDGTLRETSTFPVGRNHFFRRAGSIASSHRIGKSIVRIQKDGSTDSSLVVQSGNAIKTASDDWVKHYVAVMGQFDKSFYLPKDIYMTCESDARDIMSKSIVETDLSRFTFRSEPMNPIFVDFASTEGHVQVNPEHEHDEFLSIGAVACKALRYK